MNILFITAYDSMGQQFNGYLLQNELIHLGHHSNMIVLDKSIDDPHVHLLGNKPTRLLNRALTRIERRLSFHTILPNLGLSLLQSPLYKNADIIHLQLLHSRPFISLLHLPEISKHKKVIWTIHDPWITTGHCIHPLECQKWLTGCGSCPDLKLPIPMRNENTALNYKIKKWAMERSNIHLVASSQWMVKRFQASPILSHLPYTVIPFGVNKNIFHPIEKQRARRVLNIPENADVILFRWAPNYILKGPQYIKEALEQYNPVRETYIITLEEDHTRGLGDLNPKYKFVDMGWVKDREEIAMILNTADVFLMPSLAESFGLMAIESMACGTPVIVFKSTALEEITYAPKGGIAVNYKDAGAIAEAIQQVLQDEEFKHKIIKDALEIIDQNYTIEKYAYNHIELYKNISSTP